MAEIDRRSETERDEERRGDVGRRMDVEAAEQRDRERRVEGRRIEDRERRRRIGDRDQGAWPYAGPLSATGYRPATYMGRPGTMGYPWSRFSHGTDPSYEDWQGPGFGTHTPGGWEPRVDAYHRGNDLIVRVELPGWDKDEVSVCVEDDDLVVEGTRQVDGDTEEERRVMEGIGGPESYSAERFSTRVALPSPVDSGDIKATFKNGVLEVRVPTPDRQSERRTVKIDT